MNEDLKSKLHDMIKRSDLAGLKKWIDSAQLGLLSFDDPSLVMMAIEVYLDPSCLTGEEFQLEIVEVLTKCGLKYWAPGGGMMIYLWEWWYGGESDEEEVKRENEEFERKVLEVCQVLLDNGDSRVAMEIEVGGAWGAGVSDYLIKSRAAIRIQRWWRGSREVDKK